uniref:Disease resistance protein RPM1-like n=1 Tax=Ananas comosus var. bracteatus TaxID=296719 RepID=A0A6V7P6Z0_ANACO|nr:unnamed protein product [Ananas comosus var. bracteatus]
MVKAAKLSAAKSSKIEHVMVMNSSKIPEIEHVMGREKYRISEIQHARGTEKVIDRKVEHVTGVERAKSPKLEHVMRILSISYKDLPYNLKSCFLYFNMFPKNYSIKRVTLIRLWIAEGFARSEEGKTLEEVAVGYLNELMQRAWFKYQNLMIMEGFKLLRILDLEGAPIEMLPKQFGSLLNLRYLSLRNTKVSELPKSLRKLINLQTLDLKGTYVSELPSQIIKLKNLRHLLAYRYYIGQEPPYYYALGIKVPQGIGRLGELQKLIYLDAKQNNGVLRELGGLTQLRRLGIVNLRNQDGLHLCSSVSKMKELRSLSVSSIYIEEQHEQLDLQYFEPPERLERLYLRGPLENLPPWFSSLHNLKRLRLRWSKLAENSLEVLHGLPNLIELVLVQAYEGQRLDFNQGFPQLKITRSIEQLSSLKELHLFDMDALMGKIKRGGWPKGQSHSCSPQLPYAKISRGSFDMKVKHNGCVVDLLGPMAVSTRWFDKKKVE